MAHTYKYVTAPKDHPLLPPNRRTMGEHRLILWEKIGSGSHPCHHCGQTVTWSPGKGLCKGALVVDHLDDNPRNNDPDNLVPSCHTCNKSRTVRHDHIRDDEPFVISRSGRRVRAVPAICEECHEDFLAPRRNVRPQRFCSPACSSRNARRKTLAKYGSGVNSRSVRDDELFIIQGDHRVRAVGKTCEACGNAYLAAKSAAKQRFCSNPCRHRGHTKIFKSREAGPLG